jgi:Flp pilus assembly protein TadG
MARRLSRTTHHFLDLWAYFRSDLSTDGSDLSTTEEWRTPTIWVSDMRVRAPRRRGERGATLIESAIITPVLMLFVFGIFEFGFAFRDYLTVANSTRDGARAASVAGAELDADYRALLSISRASAALPDDAIEQIIIYKAAGPDADPTAGCLAGTSVPGVCNVYLASDLQRPADEFGCNVTSTVAPNAPDDAWCPTTRETSVGSGLDYVGVFIAINHDYVTGMFGSQIEMDDRMILKVEPQSR